ncbi:PilW family protein [Methylophaga sp.]|uniref:PilW family protein n=1 Tax=Methylophaga sp. TaxID=2024840 RepID=UPI003F697D31
MSTLKNQKGLSLIELMVSLLIGLIIITAVIEVFLSSRQVYRVQTARAHIQENGRYAMHVLTDELLNVGYQGCGSFQVDDGDVTNTLNTPNNFAWNFSRPIQGAEATGPNLWAPSLDPGLTVPVGGSDVITVRSISQPEVLVTNHPGGTPPGSAVIMVPSGNLFEQSDIVMVTDCESAAIFQITNANPSTSGNLVHNTGGATSPGNSTKELGKNYTGGWVSRLMTKSFYVRNNADGIPALYTKQSTNNVQELISGVESLQLQYGVDTDGDSSVDNYLTANAVADWSQVVSISIDLVIVSEEDNLSVDGPQNYVLGGTTVTPTDRRLRSVFSKTITLRNRVP